MKAILAVVIAALLVPVSDYAQTPVNKSIAVLPGQSILMHFDYPEMIRVSTWEKNEVSIQGTVSINSGENDDAFELFTTSSGNTVSIKNEIKNLKKPSATLYHRRRCTEDNFQEPGGVKEIPGAKRSSVRCDVNRR